MKTAFATWDGRIAPVFDTARQIHIVEAESGRIVAETDAEILEDLPVQRTLHLVQLGVGTLVCGAISRPMRGLVAAYGIDVVPFVAGELSEVVRAWLSGHLTRELFAMPGCFGRGGRRFRGMRGRERGAAAFCVCPRCGRRDPHERGVPCTQQRCSQCGSPMVRA